MKKLVLSIFFLLLFTSASQKKVINEQFQIIFTDNVGFEIKYKDLVGTRHSELCDTVEYCDVTGRYKLHFKKTEMTKIIYGKQLER
jgi:hypothetical protein